MKRYNPVMKRPGPIAAVGALLLAISLGLPICNHLAAAQEKGPGQSSPGYFPGTGATAGAGVDDATLKQTAKAYVKVGQIVQRRQEELGRTSDDAAKEKVAEQTQLEKQHAVKAQGLEPEQYNRVLQLLQADPNLREKFLSYVKQINVHKKIM